MKDQKHAPEARANMRAAWVLRRERERALAEQANRDRLPPAEGPRT